MVSRQEYSCIAIVSAGRDVRRGTGYGAAGVRGERRTGRGEQSTRRAASGEVMEILPVVLSSQ